MAISKAALIVNSSGGSPSVSGNYWVTRGIYISPSLDTVRATMALFTSKGAFLSGGAALYEQDYDLNGANNPLGMGALKPIVEAQMIACLPQFVSGVVVS